MSGFLRRLAAQAMGVANPVRAAASSPFAGPQALAEEFLPVSGDIAPVVSASGTRVEQRVDLRAATPATPSSADSSAGQFPGSSAVNVDPAGRSTALPPAGGSQGTANLADVTTREQTTDFAPSIAPSHLLPVDRDAAALPGLLPERRPFAGNAKAQEAQTGITPIADYPSTEVGPTELLLPVPARPRSARGLFEREQPGVGRRPTGNRSAAVEETTEVHVTIGRIEVTAVHEAPPAKRAAPNRPAPMSLQDYLAKRQGGRL